LKDGGVCSGKGGEKPDTVRKEYWTQRPGEKRVEKEVVEFG